MTESTQIMYDPKQLVSLLLRDQGIREGIWMLSVEFVLGVGMSGPSAEQVMPTAMASVARIGISRVPEKNSYSYDASELNPVVAKPRKAARKSL